MAKRRRQASFRISWLARNSSNGIGWFFVHSPPGERKSGMPHSVEIPAPVKGTMACEVLKNSRSVSTAVSRSGAIMYGSGFQADPPQRRASAAFKEHSMRYLHTMLRVRNLDQSVDFFCNKLGLKEVRRYDDQKDRFTNVFLA